MTATPLYNPAQAATINQGFRVSPSEKANIDTRRACRAPWLQPARLARHTAGTRHAHRAQSASGRGTKCETGKAEG